MRTKLLLMIVALLGATACEPPCDDGCADAPPSREVVGSPWDFTLGPQARDGIEISAPTVCGWEGDGVAISVHNDGSVEQPTDLIAQVVYPALVAEAVEVVSWGFSACTDTPAAWISIDDWSQANDAVVVIGKALRGREIDGTIELRIAKAPEVACAQIACGY